MSTNYNSDISYQQSQSWNQRSNKFDLATEVNEIPKVILRDKEIEIIEPEQIKEISNSSQIDIQESIQETQIPKVEEKQSNNNLNENSVYRAKTGFHLWLKDLNSGSKEKVEETQKPKIGQNRSKSQKPIKTDLEEIKDLSPASETLASLLVSQGYNKEAIAMYEKLSLLFPEKKPTFAALIGKLKN